MTSLSIHWRRVALAWLTSAALAAPAIAQQVQPAQSEIGFTFKQIGVPVKGQFKRWRADVAFNPAQPQSAKVTLEIDMTSAAFGAAETEAEVIKPDWFDAPRFPKASFISQRVQSQSVGKYLMEGTLTIKGKAQALAVPITWAQQGANATASGQFTIDRLAFNIGAGEWGDPNVVAKDVQVNFKFTLAGVPAAH